MHQVKKTKLSEQSFPDKDLSLLSFFFSGRLLIRRLVCPRRLTFSNEKLGINFLHENAMRALPFEFDIIFLQLIWEGTK